MQWSSSDGGPGVVQDTPEARTDFFSGKTGAQQSRGTSCLTTSSTLLRRPPPATAELEGGRAAPDLRADAFSEIRQPHPFRIELWASSCPRSSCSTTRSLDEVAAAGARAFVGSEDSDRSKVTPPSVGLWDGGVQRGRRLVRSRARRRDAERRRWAACSRMRARAPRSADYGPGRGTIPASAGRVVDAPSPFGACHSASVSQGPTLCPQTVEARDQTINQPLLPRQHSARARQGQNLLERGLRGAAAVLNTETLLRPRFRRRRRRRICRSPPPAGATLIRLGADLGP